ncbi:MAG: M23 family metallopeptidase [Lachnospiraceae bacterium]|nr:M23 family metallopeptidase [Lachnospiraceae bacterium]
MNEKGRNIMKKILIKVSLILCFTMIFSVMPFPDGINRVEAEIVAKLYWPVHKRNNDNSPGESIKDVKHPYGEKRGTAIHQGIDIGNAKGCGWYAACSGEIYAIYTGCETDMDGDHMKCNPMSNGQSNPQRWNNGISDICNYGLGNGVIIECKFNDGQHYYLQYAHMNEVSSKLKVGDPVKKGDYLGTVGNKGNAKGIHAHFEINKGGVFKNPINNNPNSGKFSYVYEASVGNTSINLEKDAYTTANEVTLEWSKAQNAKTYDCVLENETRNTTDNLDGLTGTSHSFGKLEEGKYVVKLTPRNGEQSGKEATAKFTVKFASGVPVQAANTVKTYDGNAYGITIKDKGEYPKETKITYAINESGPYQSKAIKISEAGQLRVYYKVENPHYASVKKGSQKIVINKVRPNIKIASYTGEYDGKAHTVELKGVPQKATIQYRTSTLKKWSDEEISLTNPGKKTVYVKVDSPNYTKAWTGKGIIKITKNGKVSNDSAAKTTKKKGNDVDELVSGEEIQQLADGSTVLGKGVYKITFNKKSSGWMDIVAETNCKVSHDINKGKVFQQAYGKGETIVSSLSQDAVTISVHSGKIKLMKAAGDGNNNLLYSVKEADHDIFYGRVVKAGESLTVRNDNYSSDITKNKVTVYFCGTNAKGERTVTDNWYHRYMPSLHPEPNVNTFKDLPENGQGWQPYGNQTTVEYDITAGEFRVFVYWKDKDMISFMK